MNKSLESQIQALDLTVQKLERKEMHGTTHGTITDLMVIVDSFLTSITIYSCITSSKCQRNFKIRYQVGAEGPELVSVNVQGSLEPTKSSGGVQEDITAPDDATQFVEPADIAATVRRGSRNIKTSRVLKRPYEITSKRGKQIALRRHTRLSVAAFEAREVGK